MEKSLTDILKNKYKNIGHVNHANDYSTEKIKKINKDLLKMNMSDLNNIRNYLLSESYINFV